MVFERHVLPNGARVLTAPMRHAQSVACFVMFAAGSRYERPQTRGIAHFLEHMLFKGTERRPTTRALTREIDSIGGVLNAATSKEYTYYYVRCAAQFLDTALDVLLDMLWHPRLNAEEIEREKGVIFEEMNAHNDTPRDYVDELFEELVYEGHPLAWRIKGVKDTVGAATRETFVDYMRWYQPGRMVLGVAGQIDDGLVPRVGALVGDRASEEPAGPATVPPVLERGRWVNLETKDSDQAHICIGASTYPLGHPDRYVLQTMATLLGGGMSSRLFQEVRERRGLAYSLSALSHGYTDGGSLWAQAGVDIRRIDDAVATVAHEFKRLADEPVLPEELDTARNFTKGRSVLQLETPQAMINFGLRREVLEGHVAEPSDILAGLDAVTGEDVQRVAQDTIGRRGLQMSVIGPFDDPSRFERLLEHG